MDYLIKNACIYDPESGNRKISDLGIKNGIIERIDSNISFGKEVIDAEGLSLVPGFIDIHMHEDPIEDDGTNYFNTEECMLKMGVTTVVGGNCGFTPKNMDDYFKYIKANGAPANTLMYLGYNTIRGMLDEDQGSTGSAYRLGNVDRSLTQSEIEILKSIVRKSMKIGAIGVSFGLIYTPGITTEEIIQIVKVLGDYKNPMTAYHHRNYASKCLLTVDENIQIANEAKVPFQFSHIGSCAAYGHGYMKEALEKLDKAISDGIDISIDCYPYNAFATLIGSTVFDEGCFEEWNCDYSSVLPTEGKYKNQYCTKESFEHLRKNEPNTRVVCFAMNEEDVQMALKNPNVMVGSDGKISRGQGHPRGAGTFPRILGKYVRENGILTFEEAIKKMTLMPANRLGFTKKGRIKEGCDADITILNNKTVNDNASFMEPTLPPTGIEYVFVNGILSMKNGVILKRNSGKLIRRQEIL